MATNNILKHQDIAHYQERVRNWERKRIEEDMSLQNVERWRQEVYQMRAQNIKTLRTSKLLSQELVKNSKGIKDYNGDNESMSSGSSFAGSKGGGWGFAGDALNPEYLIASNTSSVVKS